MGVAGTFTVKSGLAQMAKGGLVMDVTDAKQARIAEEAGVRDTQGIWTRVQVQRNHGRISSCSHIND